MKNSNEGTFAVKGINKKGEVIMGLIMVVIIIVTILVGLNFFSSKYSFKSPPFFSFLFLLSFGFVLALLSGKHIGKKLSWVWNIKIEEEGIFIFEKSRKHFVPFDELVKGMCIGTPGMRLLSIKSREKIWLRVGTGGYAPYSSENDIIVFDNLMVLLEKRLDLNQFEIKKSNDNKTLFGFEFWRYN